MMSATMGALEPKQIASQACHICEFDCDKIRSEHQLLSKNIKETVDLIDKLKSEKYRTRKKVNETKGIEYWNNRVYFAEYGLRNCKDEATNLVNKLNSLQEIFDKLCFANNSTRRGRYSPKGEQDNHTLHFRMQHGTKNLRDERKLGKKKRGDDSDQRFSSLKEIDDKVSGAYSTWRWHNKNEEGKKRYEYLRIQREEAIVNAVVKGKFWDSLGSKEDTQKQIKVIKKKLNEISRKKEEYYDKLEIADQQIYYLERRKSNLEEKSSKIGRKLDIAQQSLMELRLKEFRIEQCLEKQCSCSES